MIAKNISITAESGIAWTGYNYFQVPGTDPASRVDLGKGKGIPNYRIYAKVFLSENWSLRLLYAPLTVKYKSIPTSAVIFDGDTFGANEPLNIKYKFNSYRSTLIRKWGGDNETQWSLGLTLKVRDAHIELSNSQSKNRYSNVGFVPLIYLGVWTPLTDEWSLSADLDGLAGGPGRAFEGRIQSEYEITEKHRLALGYRFLEGGVKNNKVNNFALFHYMFAAYTLTL